MLYAYIEDGKLKLRTQKLGQKRKLLDVSIGFEEREKLVAYMKDQIRGQKWDGRVNYTASMHRALEGGWPEIGAIEYLEKCVQEAVESVRIENLN
jgi:hypothetical protein